jgi:hypothetical protein
MEIVNKEEKGKILDKISRHLNITQYYDYHELSTEDYSEKYSSRGMSQKNFREIRFFPETNVIVQIKKILSPEIQYFILPINNHRTIYKDKSEILDQLFPEHSGAHVIIADCKFNWILIKNEFNKLIGIGDQIRKKIEKNTHLAFDNVRIMYSLADCKQEEISGIQ